MNQSSSKTHKQQCLKTVLPNNTTKTERRKKKLHQQQSSRSRNPFQDLNNGGISIGSTSTNTSTSNASSLSSIEAPRGCLRFFLAHSSSSTTKTPFNNSNNNHRLRRLKAKPLSSKTPKSAPNIRPTRENSSTRNLFNKPISQEVEKVKRNAPLCLNQWQSGKKPSFKNVQSCKISSLLDSRGSPVNKRNRACDCDVANLTPLSKVGSGSGLNFAVDNSRVLIDNSNEKSNSENNTNSKSSNTKTPPIQASVSPEIQCGSSVMSTTATNTITPTCYGAGHVLSGVTDKRKCRPRGILAVGEAKALGSFDGSDDGTEQHNALGLVNRSSVSMLPLPAEASMHWLLSPCNEEDEDQKENSENGLCHFQKLEERALHNSPASPSSGNVGYSSDLCNKSSHRSISSASTRRVRRRRRRSASLLSPIEPPEFGRFLEPPLFDDLAISSLEEERKNNPGGDSTPFSMGLLGSGNLIQTPQSDSSSDRQVGIVWLSSDGSKKTHNFDSELNPVADHLKTASLSPKSHASIWDPTNASFQFDCFTTSSNSVDLSRFQKVLDDQASWFSDSTLENISQSQMRISWREGLVSRIFEMDEFDCCRCLSDEEDDANGCNNDSLKSHWTPELNIEAEKDQISTNSFGSVEFIDRENGNDGEAKEGLPSQVPCSCAESISTDVGDLVRSDDSDWTLCYKNELFQV